MTSQRSAGRPNLYRPGFNFDLESPHILPGLIRKLHEINAARVPEAIVFRVFRWRAKMAGVC
jgi:hypothetical protein